MRQKDLSSDAFKRYKVVSSTFRSMMRRLGFDSPSVKCSDVDGFFVVTAYDPIEFKYFCRSYSLEDLEAITRSSDIFWRFIK